MAFIFGDSFAHYQIADITKKWTVSTLSTPSAISQSFALPPLTFSLLMNGNGAYIAKTLPSALETFVIGFWWRAPDDFANASTIATGHDGGTEHVSIRYNTSGNMTFTRNASVLATSVNTFSASTWYHIEMKVTIGDAGDTPSGRYEVRVNGSATNWIPDSGAGQDTRNGGNKSISAFRLVNRGSTSSGGANHCFSSAYILDTSGTVANNFLGPCRFAVLTPATVGHAAEWAGNFADNWRNVSDVLGDGDSTFNQSSTAGQKDKFTLTDVVSGTVHAVQSVLLSRQDAGAARVVRPITRIGSTDYNGTSFPQAASYVFYCDPMTLSPATSAQWTDSEVNAAQFGYELVS